jgi:glycosyltransferase involved in cell wall biosynthesis
LMLGGDHGARLDDRLVQPGWLPPETLSAYLLAADVALLPYVDGASARRGSLLACAEHGLPIVTTTPAAPEVAAAVQAVPATPQTLAEAVLDPTLKSRVEAPTKALAAKHKWPRIAQAHVKIYERLLDQR